MSRKTNPVAGGDTALIAQYNSLRDESYASSMLLPRQQASPDLTLYVSDASVYFGNTRVDFAGGNSPSFTAPASNPRIDVLSINSAGTLVRTAGAEAASPVAPAVPTGDIPICQVYNVVGQTKLYESNVAGSGYIYKDIRPGLRNGVALTPVIKVYRNSFGNGTTRYDITNPTGTTYRYTYDGTGANPNISLVNVPIGTILVIAGQNFNAANNGTFIVTGAGANYFEITNASGVAENDKTLGTGTIKTQYVKPSNLLYAIIECVGGGGLGRSTTANETTYSTGQTTSFGALLTALGGEGGYLYNTINQGIGGVASGGDINIDGCNGITLRCPTGGKTRVTGGVSALGKIGQGGQTYVTDTSDVASGGGGAYTKKIILASSISATENIKVGHGGTSNAGNDGVLYEGYTGAVIITEILF